MKRIFLISLFLFLILGSSASAQGILPSGEGDLFSSCDSTQAKDALKNEKKFTEVVTGSRRARRVFSQREVLNELLGCAVKTGRIRLFMVPFFITFIIQFLLSIAGIISVGFMVIGGYKYAVGGLIEDKESGKKTVLHALVGLLVALSSWIVVNFIQVALTS